MNEVKLSELIKKYEGELRAHKSGVMMSMNEMIHGEIWCVKILKDLRELEDG